MATQAPEAAGVKVCSNKGDLNETAEVWSAYDEAASLEPVAGGDGAPGGGGGQFGPSWVGAEAGEMPAAGPAGRTRPDEPPGDTLSWAHVTYMVSDPESWKLRVNVGGDAYEVIARDELRATQNRAHGTGSTTHPLREPRAGEVHALKWDAEKGPAGTDGLLKELAGVPAALIGGAASIAALFAAGDKANGTLLTIALLLFGGAAIVAAIGSARVRLVKVYPSRLDQLEQRYEKALKTARSRWQIPVALSVLGLLVFIGAFVASDEEPSASAKIRVFNVDRSDERLTATVRVEWSGLPDDAKSVNTKITGGSAPIDRDTSDISDGVAVQRITVRLPEPGTLQVHTRALDASGDQVGQGRDQPVTVK